MISHDTCFRAERVLHELKHFLPSQAPLKDFIHHNTLHAFQELKFHEALDRATQIFGYKVYLTLSEYRSFYQKGTIKKDILQAVLKKNKPENPDHWEERLLYAKIDETIDVRIGKLRSCWKEHFRIDMDALVHPTLFRIIGSYLDQGVAIWNFPVSEKGFLASVKELEKNSLVSLFKTKRVKQLLLTDKTDLNYLLKLVVGREELYEYYIFDQQFAHPGWSGMVSVLEDNPHALIDTRNITLDELIRFELLMEIDALDDHFGEIWSPIGLRLEEEPLQLFSETPVLEVSEVKKIWQEAYEWSYYDQVLRGLQLLPKQEEKKGISSFQAVFCIDDRECSLRRYIEEEDHDCKTYGTAGFFNVEFFYQPEHGKFYTKVCPAPVTPKHVIKEYENKNRTSKDLHFGKQSHGLVGGWLLTQTLGLWSVIKLFLTVFRPSETSTSVSSFRHMDKHSLLTIENSNGEMTEDGLQVGFTLEEMANRLEGLLRSIGMIDQYAPLVYVVGHGSSSVNNTHYAGYDCGACSGRPGSVNARVICHIGNHVGVRKILSERGIEIPATTQFVGALHDTSRDEMMYYDLKVLNENNFKLHKENEEKFNRALSNNARERSRRFESINSTKKVSTVHKEVKQRTVSLFEPRPELNHATNTLCIVGRRMFSDHLFLDRRSFLNSFDYTTDPQGNYLLNILNAVAPVCGGINLEYFFSRVDNQNLGAGTKLPHNVMGLIGVANGIDGDLRTGLPSQMIEVHDPIRLLVIVEHYPEVVLDTIKRNPATYQWFEKDWVKLVAVNPDSKAMYLFSEGVFSEYQPLTSDIPFAENVEKLILSSMENLPVSILKS